MALRRSNRRMTITGSSMFVASTPVVPTAIQENDDENASPKWVSAEEAFRNMKTPNIGKMTRRTTLTRQNIFNDETIIGGANTDGVFKPPSFFVPLSPPGMKTRSRRSSMHMGPPPPAKAKKVANEITGKKNVSGKNSAKPVRKTASKTVSEVASEAKEQKQPVLTKVSSRKSITKRPVDGGDTKFTNIEHLSPVVDSVEIKKPRRSIRHHVEEETMVTNEVLSFSHSFQTPQTHDAQKHDNPKSLITDTPKVLATPIRSKKSSQITKTLTKTPKSNTSDDYKTLAEDKTEKTSTKVLSGLKRQMSKEENDQIDEVVKIMFTPSKFYSAKESNKQSFASPSSGKKSASPARRSIARDSMTNRRKSPARKALEMGVAPNTPSQAARKARKILGVSINSTPLNDNTENRVKRSMVVEESLSREESLLSSSVVENENNMTLSHSSHSQWCTIL